jgi:hypothetical protein
VSFLPARGEFPEVSSCDSSGQGKTRAPSKISETYAKYCVQTAQQFLGSTPRRKLRSHKRGQSQKSRDSKAPAVQLVCARIKSRTTKVKSYKSQEQQKPGNVSVWLTSQSTDITKYCHPERSEGPAVCRSNHTLAFSNCDSTESQTQPQRNLGCVPFSESCSPFTRCVLAAPSNPEPAPECSTSASR